ncbi:MAG: protein TolQ [Oligoflexia bacterium]|nr:protein TolQ [Oligoflexia bacterium]
MKLDAWELIWNAGPVVKFVMIVLAGFSVVSWAIIFTKHTQLSKVTAENASFLDLFWKASSLENINAEVGRFKMSPLANVFRAGYSELQRIAESRLGEKSSSGALSLSGIENVSRALRKASDSEVAKIEGRTGFLATVGSTSPFIGLFGTVWGIMNSFQNIGNTGAASLSVVAPGISEALIATAIGLAAAIPAVMAYNYFVGKFKKQDLEINNFTADFLNIVKRNFFKD